MDEPRAFTTDKVDYSPARCLVPWHVYKGVLNFRQREEGAYLEFGI
jgi:hypothetical protein